MEVSLNQLIEKLQSVKIELKDKPIKVYMPNGELTNPEICFCMKRDSKSCSITNSDVDYIVLR